MRIVIRIFLVLIGTVAATIAAGIAAAASSIAMHATLSDFTGHSLNTLWNIFGTALFLWIYLIFWIVFIPYAIAAVLTEILGIRSLLLYLLGAIAVALLSPVFGGVLPWLSGVPSWFGGAQMITWDLLIPSIAAGLAAGFVYWLIAGRKAGSWRAT